MGAAKRLLPFLVVALILVLAVLFTRGADSQTLPIRTTQETTELRQVAREIGAFRQFTWNCQDDLNQQRHRASVDVWSLSPSVPYRVWVRELWGERYAACKKALQYRSVPSTGDWVTAVDYVQRIYPGTRSWLLSCSDGEGGHGGFVMNHHGSGAGGWMQFLSSTFYSNQEEAFEDARNLGFVIDRTNQSWYNPLGQALTAAYMRTHGMSNQWDPSIDALCR